MKDSKGQYACRDCVQAKQRSKQAPTGETSKAAPALAQVDAPAADVGLGMDKFLGDVQVADANPCPKCGNARAAGAVVCMQCGFDSASGKAMTTKVGKDKPKRERRAPRMSSGKIYIVIALSMLVLLSGLAMTSVEGAGIALLVTVLWNLVAYAYMVGSAFRDDDKFWGLLGVLFWLPLAGQFCWLAFVLYYCTIGSQRGVRKVNYWASWLALMIALVSLAVQNPELFATAEP